MSSALVATFTYWILNYSQISQAAKWEIFWVYLLATYLGFLIGMYGVLRGWWLSIVPAVLCSVFFYLQVLS